jgi:hypothetical protein
MARKPKDALAAAFAEPRDDEREELEQERNTLEDALGDAVDFDDPRFANAKWKIYRLNDDGTVPPGAPGVGVFLRSWVGPLDMDKVRDAIGGGCFRLVGTMPDRSRPSYIVAIEGPRIVPPAAVTTPASPAPGSSSEVAELRAEIRQLASSLAQPRQTDPLELFRTSLEYARSLLPPPPPPAGAELMQGMFTMFDRGYRLGRDGGADEDRSSSPIAELAREVLPLVTALSNASRNAPAPAPALSTGTPGELAARAQAQTPALPASRPTTSDERRVDMLTEILAKAIARNQDVHELVEVVDGILTDEESANLAHATPEVLLLRIGEPRRALYPSLSNERAVPYLTRFLEQFRAEDDDDDVAGDDEAVTAG